MKIGNAPCSWGVLEFESDTAAQAPATVLAEMARAGYAGTELGDWGFLPTAPRELTAALARHALALIGAFVPVRFIDDRALAAGRATALRTARLLAETEPQALVILADDNGAVPERARNAGRITRDQELTGDALCRYARGVEQVARAVVEETGQRVVFHHHAGGFIETPREVAGLLRHTSAELLGLCLDTGHYAMGGGRPEEALERHAARLGHVHFKDFDPAVVARARVERLDYLGAVRAGVFPELGRGAVVFPEIGKMLAALSYDRWIVVEQDVLPGMGTPSASAVRNRHFLREIFSVGERSRCTDC
jgi:inosose dehydratase